MLAPMSDSPVHLAPVSELSPRPVPDVEFGTTLVDMPFGGFSSTIMNPAERYHGDLLNDLDEMQRMDGHMRAMYRLLSLPFRQASYSIEPAEGGEREAEFLESVLTLPPHSGGMSTSFDYIRACASKACLYGYAAFEKVWTVTTMEGFGLVLTLRKLAPREARTVSFKVDGTGGFDGIKQSVPSRGVVEIPKDKCWFFTVDKEDHPFYGRSMFEPALYHYDKKKKLYYIAHIAAQFAAVPGRLGHIDGADVSPEQKAEFRKALADFGFNTSMLVPKGVRVEPFASGGHGVGAELLALINHHNIQASQSILAQFIDLSMGGSGGTGSRALSEDMSGLFLMTLQALLGSFGEHLNWHLFPTLIDWNFPNSRKYPTIKFDPLSDEMQDAMIEVFKVLVVAAQTQATPDFIFELEKRMSDKFGLPVDYETIEAERDAQQAAEVQGGIDTLSTIQGILNNPPKPEVIEKPVAAPPSPRALAAAEAEERILLLAESKRDAVGRFAAVNELGFGAGFQSRGQDQHKSLVTDLQARLEALGFDLGVFGTDGLFGNITAAATKAFQQENGLPQTGRVDLATYALLVEEAPDVEVDGADVDNTHRRRGRDVNRATRGSTQPFNRKEALRRLRAVKAGSGGGTGAED